jgi:hypothetical protein
MMPIMERHKELTEAEPEIAYNLFETASGLFELFEPWMTVLQNTHEQDVEDKIDVLAKQSVVAYYRRLRRFRRATILFYVFVIAAAWAISYVEGFPWPYSVAAVVILYLFGVLLPAFDRPLRPSGRYHDELDQAFGRTKPLGIFFDCLEVESIRRLKAGGASFLVGVAAIAISHYHKEVGVTIFKSAGLILIYFGAVVVLPVILVAIATTELIPKAALKYPPERDAFIAVCDVLQAASCSTVTNEVQRFMVARLESLATCFERKIPQALGLDRGSMADQTVLRHFAIIAADMRSWKDAAALPKRNTGEELSKQMASTGAALALRRYGCLLESRSADSTPIGVSRVSIVLLFLRTLLFALGPGIAVIVFHRLIDPHLQASLIVFSISWAVANLAAADPRSKDILSLTKDVSGMVSTQ